MKLYFIVFLIVNSSTKYYYIKVPFSYCYVCEPITCDEQFEKTVKFIPNPKYKNGNGENWILIMYKNKRIFGHYCIDDNGNYYVGYKEKTDWQLK